MISHQKVREQKDNRIVLILSKSWMTLIPIFSTCVTESLCCTSETNTTVLINYTPI